MIILPGRSVIMSLNFPRSLRASFFCCSESVSQILTSLAVSFASKTGNRLSMLLSGFPSDSLESSSSSSMVAVQMGIIRHFDELVGFFITTGNVLLQQIDVEGLGLAVDIQTVVMRTHLLCYLERSIPLYEQIVLIRRK